MTGRPHFRPTEREKGIVSGMAMIGATRKEIAQKIGVHANTLRKHFAEELDPFAYLRVEETFLDLCKTAYKSESRRKRDAARCKLIFFFHAPNRGKH